MFSTNTLHQQQVQSAIRPETESTDWIFGIVVLMLGLMGIYLNSRKFKLKDIFMSLFDKRVLERVSRESNIKSISLVPMAGIYVAGLAMMAYNLLQGSGFVISLHGIALYLAMAASFAMFVILKNWLILLLGNIFQDKAPTALYITNGYLFHFVGGLVLTPLLLAVFFGGNTSCIFLNIAALIIIIIFITRLLRGFQLILTNTQNSKLHLFYYLCILEVVPFLILVKILFL